MKLTHPPQVYALKGRIEQVYLLSCPELDENITATLMFV